MSKKITVLGATGNIGTALVHQLLQAGHAVAAVARPSARLDALAAAGATAHAGDAHDAAFLTEALRGADAAFLMIPPNMAAPDVLAHMDAVGEATAQAVRDSGLKSAVHLSSIGADVAAGTGPVRGLHLQEARLNAIAGLAVTHLRPAYFMENLLANIGMIQHLGLMGSAQRPDVAISMVATADIAARAAEILHGPIKNGRVEYLVAPREYAMEDARAAIAQAIGKPELPYIPFPAADARQGMVQAGLSESMADLYLEMINDINHHGAMVLPPAGAARHTGPTTLEQFVQERFTPAFAG